MSRLWKIDAALWLAGALIAVAGIVDGWRSGRPLAALLRASWFYFSGAALVTALVVLLVLALRWRASREAADLLRTYPPKGP